MLAAEQSAKWKTQPRRAPSPPAMAGHDDQKKAFSRIECKQVPQCADRAPSSLRSMCMLVAAVLAALVHAAMYKYVMTKKEPDCSEALRRLFTSDIEPKVDRQVLARPNVFRAAHCYTRDTSKALARHEDTLRNLYAGLSAARGQSGHAKSMLDVDCFVEFCRMTELLAADLSERDALLCFNWSRMYV